MIRIEGYSPGHMTVNGQKYDKDMKIIGDRVIAEWWRNRDHRLDVDDVKDILSPGIDLLVVGTGYAENMRVEKGLQSLMRKENITLIAQDTHTAVKTFNRLRGEGKDAAGAFHLTC